MKSPISVGLVGLGRISKNHVNALANLKHSFKLTDICDTDASVLELSPFVNKNVRTFTSYDEFLEKSICDLVILCTPSGLHPPQAIAALNKGLHVLVEKPMAFKELDAQKMVEASSRNNKHLFIVKQNRVNPTVVVVKRLIDEKFFGNINLISSNVFWQRPQHYYDLAEWRGTRALDGGAIMNQASHYVDLLGWLFGPISKIEGFASTLERKIEMEDTAICMLRWVMGAVGSLNVTMLTYPKNLEGSITVLGSKGSLKLGGIALNKIDFFDFSDKKAEEIIQASDSNYQTSSVYGNGHQNIYENIYNVFYRNEKAICSGVSGLETVRYLESIYNSFGLNNDQNS